MNGSIVIMFAYYSVRSTISGWWRLLQIKLPPGLSRKAIDFCLLFDSDKTLRK